MISLATLLIVYTSITFYIIFFKTYTILLECLDAYLDGSVWQYIAALGCIMLYIPVTATIRFRHLSRTVYASVIKTCAILLKRLIDYVYRNFNLLRRTMLHILVTEPTFPVVPDGYRSTVIYVSIVKPYVVLLKILADSVYEQLHALGCIMLYIAAIAPFPVVYLSAAFYTVVIWLIRTTPLPKAKKARLRSTVKLEYVVPDEAVAADKVQANGGFESSDNNTASKTDGQIPMSKLSANGRIDSLDNSTASTTNGQSPMFPIDPSPVTPPDHEDCVSFDNTSDLTLPENSDLLHTGKRQKVHLNIDGHKISSNVGFTKTVLQNCENRRVFYLDTGKPECGGSFKGRMELGTRVYEGPAKSLLRVLEDEM